MSECTCWGSNQVERRRIQTSCLENTEIEKEYKITQNALGERLTFRQFDVVLPKTVQLCLHFVSNVSVCDCLAFRLCLMIFNACVSPPSLWLSLRSMPSHSPFLHGFSLSFRAIIIGCCQGEPRWVVIWGKRDSGRYMVSKVGGRCQWIDNLTRRLKQEALIAQLGPYQKLIFQEPSKTLTPNPQIVPSLPGAAGRIQPWVPGCLLR